MTPSQEKIDIAVQNFIEQCTIQYDYQDYCNCESSQRLDERITWYPACELSLINLSLNKEFPSIKVKKLISERQSLAIKQLQTTLFSIKNKN